MPRWHLLRRRPATPPPPEGAVLHALLAFLEAHSFTEAYRALKTQERLLISDEAIAILQRLDAHRPGDGSVGNATAYQAYIRLIENTRRRGLKAAWKDFLSVQVPDAANVHSTMVKIESLTQPTEMPARISLLTTVLSQLGPHGRPDILTRLYMVRGESYIANPSGDRANNIEQAIRDFGAVLTAFPDADVEVKAAALTMRANAYQRRPLGSKAENMEVALADLTHALTLLAPYQKTLGQIWAQASMSRSKAYADRMIGNREADLEQAIADCDSALAIFAKEASRTEWAQARSNRGGLYIERIAGDRRQNIEQAIDDFNAALSVIVQEAAPADWALVMTYRGLAYAERLAGDLAQNIEDGIADLEAALAILSADQHPRAWATARRNRGEAFLNRVMGDHGRNVEQAMADIEASLTVLGAEEDPYNWAYATMLHGNASLERLEGDTEQHLREAVADFEAALSVFTKEAMPLFWAEVHVSLGIAYRDLSEKTGETQYQEQALANYSAALTALDPHNRPHEWAVTLLDRGGVYARRTDGGQQDDLELAIRDFDDALSLLSREDHPFDWAAAHLNRGVAYRDRDEGSAADNLQQALADLDTALLVFTPSAAPRECRDALIARARTYEKLEQWEDAHLSYWDARALQRDFVAEAVSESSRTGLIAERANRDIYLRDAMAVLHLDAADSPEVAVLALEEGRAQSLRLALDLSTLDPSHISKPAARARAQAFVDAANSWRLAENRLRAPLLEYIGPSDAVVRKDRLMRDLEEAYAAFVRARDAIRANDDSTFLTPPSLERIAHAVAAPDEALVYLAGGDLLPEEGESSGFALILTRDEHGERRVHHLPLPEFDISDLADHIKAIPVRVTEEGTQFRLLPVGGLLRAQLGLAFDSMRRWGTSLGEQLKRSPLSAGLGAFFVAIDTVKARWASDPQLLALLDKPFSALTPEEREILESAFTRALLSIELQRSLKELGAWGLDEVAQHLQARGVHRVTFIPYGQLGFFPLPAVAITTPAGTARLGELFEVTVTPSASAAAIARQRASAFDRTRRPLVLVAGDPQPRPPGASPLPWAEAEADTVRKIAYGYDYAHDDVVYLRPSEVTRERIVPALQQSGVAFLALHGQYQPNAPRNSRLLLAGVTEITSAGGDRGNSIYLSEALDGTIVLSGLRLLVLSACETALIEVRHTPNEVIGLAAGFLQAGAAGVIASLWAVDDRATYLLMSRFAQLYLDPRRGWSPARCLAAAQRWLRAEATNAALAAYDPLAPLPLDSGSAIHAVPPEDRAFASAPVSPRPALMPSQDKSSVRSVRGSLTWALLKTQAWANVAAQERPNDLPYADPYYWAGFVVTGC